MIVYTIHGGNSSLEKYEIIRNAELHSNKLLKILKSDIGSNHMMYSKTVDRCKALKSQLFESIAILDLFLTTCCADDSQGSTSEIEKSESSLSNASTVLSAIETDIAETKMSSKDIIKHYSAAIQSLSEAKSNVIEVSMCCKMLASWMRNRYFPEKRNPKFYYKATKIHTWIDSILIAYGDAVHNNQVHIFNSEMGEWVESILTDDENIWPLPYFIQNKINSDSLEISFEAVVIEHLVKPLIYTDDFFPEYRNTLLVEYENYESTSIDFSDIKQCIYSTNLTVIGG